MFTTGMDATEHRSALTPLTEAPEPEMVPDWNNIGIFATGIALGAVLGATVALLVSPASGRELRERVARRLGRGENQSVWEQFSAEQIARDHSREAVQPHHLGVPNPHHVKAARVLGIDFQAIESLRSHFSRVFNALSHAEAERSFTERAGEVKMAFRVAGISSN